MLKLGICPLNLPPDAPLATSSHPDPDALLAERVRIFLFSIVRRSESCSIPEVKFVPAPENRMEPQLFVSPKQRGDPTKWKIACPREMGSTSASIPPQVPLSSQWVTELGAGPAGRIGRPPCFAGLRAVRRLLGIAIVER